MSFPNTYLQVSIRDLAKNARGVQEYFYWMINDIDGDGRSSRCVLVYFLRNLYTTRSVLPRTAGSNTVFP